MEDKQKTKKDEKKGSSALGCLIIIIMIFAIGGLINSCSNGDSDGDSKTTSSQTSKSKKKSSDSSIEIMEPSNESIAAAIGKQNSAIEVESVNGSYYDGDATVQITLVGREAFTDKQTEKGMLMDIADVWRAIKTRINYNSFSNIGVSVKYPLTDTAGNTEDEFVIKSSMTGNKLSEFNVKGFYYKNAPSFATDWWQSDALPSLE